MTATADLSVDEIRATLGRAHDIWERVTAETRSASRRVRIAEFDVDVVVAGDELAATLLPPFDGLPDALGPSAGTVGAWDVAATGFGFPERPPVRPGAYRCLVRRSGQPVAELEWSSRHVFRAADRLARLHLLAVGRASALSPREGAAPLRRQLSWALGPEVLFVHAGAVGDADGVALLVGASGVGKSSTSLACLRAGMRFLSDDYCLIRGDPPVVYRFYSTARLADDDVDLFADFLEPAVAASSEDAEMDADNKALYRLHTSVPDRLLDSAPARAVVMLEPRGVRRPTLEPIRPAEVLRRVAPAMLRFFSIDPARELAGLRRLLSSVPCFRLILSRDRAANPTLVQEALASAF
jgi:hypothetical protein